jgi:hypothetical protein
MVVAGPALAEALVECDCSLVDTDGYVSLLAYLLMLRPDAGWIALPASLPKTGTVGEAIRPFIEP